MKTSQKTLVLAVGGAFALSLGATAYAAGDNPFAIKALSSGYQVAENNTKMKDGKCATGKCGANKKKAAEKAKEGNCSAEKMKEGNCSAEKMKEGSCSAEKMKEGSCSAEKMKEGAHDKK